MPVAHAPLHTRIIWGGRAQARGAGERECKNKRACIKKTTQSHLDKRLVRGFAQLLTCFAHACVDREDGCGCDGQGIGLEAHRGRLRLGAVWGITGAMSDTCLMWHKKSPNGDAAAEAAAEAVACTMRTGREGILTN